MAIDNIFHLEIIEIMENYVDRNRPPLEIRNKVDLSYRIQGHSVVVFLLRPICNNPSEMGEYEAAKATYVKSKGLWNVYWLRADLKWHLYKPTSTVKDLHGFIILLEEDKHHCFWG